MNKIEIILLLSMCALALLVPPNYPPAVWAWDGIVVIMSTFTAIIQNVISWLPRKIWERLR